MLRIEGYAKFRNFQNSGMYKIEECGTFRYVKSSEMCTI